MRVYIHRDGTGPDFVHDFGEAWPETKFIAFRDRTLELCGAQSAAEVADKLGASEEVAMDYLMGYRFPDSIIVMKMDLHLGDLFGIRCLVAFQERLTLQCGCDNYAQLLGVMTSLFGSAMQRGYSESLAYHTLPRN